MNIDLKKTVFYDFHIKLKGNMVDFNGFLLPVYYTSIQEEHFSVRNNIGVFDVSHMGNIIINFKDKVQASENLNFICANDFSVIDAGRCMYSTILNFDGGVIDDIIVMSITDTQYHIIVNAGNIEKDFKWIKTNLKDGSIDVQNESDLYSIISIQGPRSLFIIEDLFNLNTGNLKFFHLDIIVYKNYDIILSRTGYTGEDGFELILKNEIALDIFNEILNNREKRKFSFCGLGARDTLRLEAGLPLLRA